jgi:hypothetical protein
MKYLDYINSPEDLKKLPQEKFPELCQEIREFLVSACSENPGHLGASLGTVELSVALHYLYNTPKDKIIWCSIRKQKLSMDFIKKYSDKLDWDYIWPGVLIFLGGYLMIRK